MRTIITATFPCRATAVPTVFTPAVPIFATASTSEAYNTPSLLLYGGYLAAEKEKLTNAAAKYYHCPSDSVLSGTVYTEKYNYTSYIFLNHTAAEIEKESNDSKHYLRIGRTADGTPKARCASARTTPEMSSSICPHAGNPVFSESRRNNHSLDLDQHAPSGRPYAEQPGRYGDTERYVDLVFRREFRCQTISSFRIQRQWIRIR